MQTHELIAHPAFPPLEVSGVQARIIGRDADWLRLRWRVEGSSCLVVPQFAGRGRADELWKTTCFEMFLSPLEGEAYSEWNLSPSERWNAYDFSGYRDGMSERPVPREPACTMRLGSSFAIFDAALPNSALPDAPSAMGLTCVIEEEGGIKSFWAMDHGKDQPDFHDASCFRAELGPPNAA